MKRGEKGRPDGLGNVNTRDFLLERERSASANRAKMGARKMTYNIFGDASACSDLAGKGSSVESNFE